MAFKDFSALVHAQYERMREHELFVVDTIDLFQIYLDAFPEGTNPIFRERTEHDCSCCKNFIRNIGNVVAIIDGKIVTVWDVTPPAPYDSVSRVLAEVVRQAPIQGVWRTKERKYGQLTSNELLPDGTVRTWDHFSGSVPNRNFSLTPDKARGDLNTTAAVLKRGLRELNLSDMDTIIDLAEANNLLRGTEFLPQLKAFRQLMAADNGTDIYIWANVQSPAARFRNTAIGQLLVELADGTDLEAAVGKYENMVSGTNYKRPTALVTPKMVEAAVAKIDELGLRGSTERRHARIEDVSIKDVLFVDNEVAGRMKDSLLESLMPPPRPTEVKNPTPISAEDFFANVVPGAKAISALVENRHASNFMSITAPMDTTEARLFSWDNDFSWSYDGDVADSVKQRVKLAGGNIDAPFRVSLAWHNTDDLDLHCYTPRSNHIYFGSKQGILDVDANGPGERMRRDPVENMAFSRVENGTYRFEVNQYSRRNSHDVGFVLEVQIGGQVMQYTYGSMVVGTIKAISIQLENGQFVDASVHKDLVAGGGSFSSEKWGVQTETLVPVQTLMLSPNHWGDRPKGNKHWFFILRDCKNPDPVRGIYNEYLRPDLNEHRKVFEVLGSKTKAPFSEAQLSGLGFSSTQRNSLKVVADGRAYEVNF